jgi:hypothetical protein
VVTATRASGGRLTCAGTGRSAAPASSAGFTWMPRRSIAASAPRRLSVALSVASGAGARLVLHQKAPPGERRQPRRLQSACPYQGQ